MDPKQDLQYILNKYKKEFEEDSVINELNLRDRQLMLPGIKHKYVAYLIQHKQKKYELEKAKKQAIHDLINNTNTDIGLSKTTSARKHESNPIIKKINDLITEQDIVIEYLEKIEMITKSMTYDMSNIIKILEMEMT